MNYSHTKTITLPSAVLDEVAKLNFPVTLERGLLCCLFRACIETVADLWRDRYGMFADEIAVNIDESTYQITDAGPTFEVTITATIPE